MQLNEYWCSSLIRQRERELEIELRHRRMIAEAKEAARPDRRAKRSRSPLRWLRTNLARALRGVL
jgi:hypothetical protein